jgi:prenyltransferase beta subunit
MSRLDRRTFLSSAARAGVAVAVGTGSVYGQSSRAANADPSTNLMTSETQQAISAGLAYLSLHQNEDGSFGRGNYSRNVAICGLAGMAFMASGSTPGRGPFGGEVNLCVQHILNNSREGGFIIAPGSASHGPMYGHGFATLFLAEVYGMHPDSMVREKLDAAVKLIISTQNDEGGWRYEPKRQDADISVTICQVMALRAARNAGIFVPNVTIDRCIDYVKRSQNPDGGFMYQLSQPGESRFPRSAAGVVAFYNAGIYEGEELERGLDYLLKHVPQSGLSSREAHFYYGHYYAVQALWQAGGDRWQRWYPAIRDTLLAQQKSDGSWFDQISPEYGTAMACIILQMPNNYLPILQR